MHTAGWGDRSCNVAGEHEISSEGPHHLALVWCVCGRGVPHLLTLQQHPIVSQKYIYTHISWTTNLRTFHRGPYVPPPKISIPGNWTPYALDPNKCGYVMYCPRYASPLCALIRTFVNSCRNNILPLVFFFTANFFSYPRPNAQQSFLLHSNQSPCNKPHNHITTLHTGPMEMDSPVTPQSTLMDVPPSGMTCLNYPYNGMCTSPTHHQHITNTSPTHPTHPGDGVHWHNRKWHAPNHPYQ